MPEYPEDFKRIVPASLFGPGCQDELYTVARSSVPKVSEIPRPLRRHKTSFWKGFRNFIAPFYPLNLEKILILNGPVI